jgi:hypothetical protein
MAEITHLGGQNTFITTTVSPPEIAPTRVMPASMTLFADIANVPAGEYMGMIDLRPTVIPGSWKLPFKITVGEPLSATLHLLSGLAPGRVTRGILTIRNSGGAVDNVRLECPGFSLPQGKVEIYDLPPRVSLPAKDDKIIAIRVAADPRIPAVATATGELLIYRTDIPNRVPVSLKLSSGESESVLAVSPASISLNGAPGSEAVFDLVVRAASAAVLPDQIDSVELSGARTATGQPVTIAAGFVTPQKKPIAKARLVPGEDLLMKGHVLLPAKAGIYRAAVKVESGQNGSREIAVQITVN